MVARLPGRLAVADVVRQVKCVSSRVASEGAGGRPEFAWQSGYGAFSLDYTTLEAAISYVQRQRDRHAAQALWAQWEETEEEVPEGDSEGRQEDDKV